MRYTLVALASLSVLAVGCNEPEKKGDKPVGNHQVGNAGGENSAKIEKSENESDRQISQGIRKALSDNASLSIASKNIRVHTRDGIVHLRGTVASEKDKQDIAAFVNRAPGVKKVENYLDVSR